MGGALIAADMYVPNKEDPSKLPKRVRIPYQALDWLIQQLENQGMNQQKLEGMNQATLAEMANNVLSNQGATPNGQAQPMNGGNLGAISSQGVA